VEHINKKQLPTVLGVTSDILGLEELKISLDGNIFTIPIKDLNITYPIDDAINYGKGYDIIKVLQSGADTISGVNIEKEYTLDIAAIIIFLVKILQK